MDSILSELDNKDSLEEEKVHIRIQQRTTRTYITVIDGLDQLNLDLNKITKYMKKIFSCGGMRTNNIIKLQGDQRNNVKNFLINENIISSDNIIVHGY